MPVEYIDPKDNMQFVDEIIDSFASKIQIEEPEHQGLYGVCYIR